ncbi:MAG TPA: heat-inducible transcriptional repressor HrcA [Thermoleophilia bacterium]|nr:heat-inducible transcriptional repressor HrcA [Thermoleophilia bacterium]
MALTPRQERVLRTVVEEYIASGSPVGSKFLSGRDDFSVASSTIRNDLAELEELGLLAHPHTSAGRVPTDDGYRHYVEAVVDDWRKTPAPEFALERERMRSEIDEALQETAEALSRITELLAVVSSPSLTGTTIKHVEVLRLQPHLVMVVLITTAGRVTKRVFSFEQSVDEGLVEYARVYLNERLTGVQLGTRLIESSLNAPDLGPTEQRFLRTIVPAFKVVAEEDARALHIGGTARLLERLSAQGVTNLNELLASVEKRYNLLELLYGAMRSDDVYLRIGHELSEPSLQACSLVAANYGVANRNLGTVSVLGPTRMDYQRAIRTVRAAAGSLSALLEEIW